MTRERGGVRLHDFAGPRRAVGRRRSILTGASPGSERWLALVLAPKGAGWIRR